MASKDPVYSMSVDDTSTAPKPDYNGATYYPMSTPHRHEEQPASRQTGAKHGHSRWMMIACCVPMLVIVLALVFTGVVGYGFLVVAIMCTLMMAAMMGGKQHGTDGDGQQGHR